MKMEAPNFFLGGYFGAGETTQFISPMKSHYWEQNNNQQFAVDELLNFSTKDEDEVVMNDAFFEGKNASLGDSSGVAGVNSCNSSGSQARVTGNDVNCRNVSDSPFSGNDLCVPYDDLAELEWLSSFVEESFSSEDLYNLQLISPTNANNASCNNIIKVATDTSSSTNSTPAFCPEPDFTRGSSNPIFQDDVVVPGKARSKRSRAAPCDWSSRLIMLNSPKPKRALDPELPSRKCLHCGSDKTPQWRTGPLGPKTLCNACGVRFKSGRLVPEYRPAASPSFMSAKHSNSHRKVMEIRRQKELRKAQVVMSGFGASNGCDDYLIHRQSGPSYMHMI